MVEATRSLPIIGDGDTGYGNAVNVKRTVRGYAQVRSGSTRRLRCRCRWHDARNRKPLPLTRRKLASGSLRHRVHTDRWPRSRL